jgi:hypothetical protein
VLEIIDRLVVFEPLRTDDAVFQAVQDENVDGCVQYARSARLTVACALAQTIVGNYGRGATAVFGIELQAISPQAQHRRAYEIHVGSDLFGQLVVTIDFGVIGTHGQRRVHLVADVAEAQVVVRRSLRDRLTAPAGSVCRTG